MSSSLKDTAQASSRSVSLTRLHLSLIYHTHNNKFMLDCTMYS